MGEIVNIEFIYKDRVIFEYLANELNYAVLQTIVIENHIYYITGIDTDYIKNEVKIKLNKLRWKL